MYFLQSLRNAHRLTRFVLVWFALFMGVAVASPLVNADSVQWVCTSDGHVQQVLAHDEGPSVADNKHGLHCPLCLPMAAPPWAGDPAPARVGLSHALRPLEQARMPSLIGLPWQARAPPSLF
jgi:hypothetical protein